MGQTSVALAMLLLDAVPLQKGNCRPTEYKVHPYPWGHADHVMHPHCEATGRYCSKEKRGGSLTEMDQGGRFLLSSKC